MKAKSALMKPFLRAQAEWLSAGLCIYAATRTASVQQMEFGRSKMAGLGYKRLHCCDAAGPIRNEKQV